MLKIIKFYVILTYYTILKSVKNLSNFNLKSR